MESFVRDVTFALRSLKRQPAFAITAVLTIALGIGATSAIFSIVNAALFKALPYPNPDNLLFGVTPLDVATFAGVACLLLVIAALATLFPAARAARIDPVRALRSE